MNSIKKDFENCETTNDVKRIVKEKFALMKTTKEKIKYLQMATELFFETKANR